MAEAEKSLKVSETEVQAVKMAIATVKAKLLFLARLTADAGRPGALSTARVASRNRRAEGSPIALGQEPETTLETDLVSELIEFIATAEELVSEVDQARQTEKRAAAGETGTEIKTPPCEQRHPNENN